MSCQDIVSVTRVRSIIPLPVVKLDYFLNDATAKSVNFAQLYLPVHKSFVCAVFALFLHLFIEFCAFLQILCWLKSWAGKNVGI